MTAQPAYSDEDLAGLSTPELWRLLIRDEDRVPRNVIEECVRRDDILASIGDMLGKDYYWTGDVGAGEAWLPLHAASILGLRRDAPAGELLVRLLRHACLDETNTLEWMDGAWPALFINKPETVIAQLRALAEDRANDAHIRAAAADSVLVHVEHGGDEKKLEGVLTWASAIEFAEDEDTDIRVDDPWAFYSPQQIAARQRRWAEEAAAELNRYGEEPGETYVRDGPKIGRNDPCPCGSGKKYKRCCLPGEG